MQRSFHFYAILFAILIAVITSAYYNALSFSSSQVKPDWHGVWVKTKSITSKEAIDQMLDKAESGGFNVIFVNVVYEGFAYYDSQLLPKSPKIASGFDPLAYLVPEAHRRGIEVHAWFMVGKFGDDNQAQFLDQYPHWAMQAPDGEETYWLNFNMPEVRAFLRDVMIETVRDYGVNGLHFDYTRYPGSQWSFDPYSIKDFSSKTGNNLELLRFDQLPAFGFLEGNPLDKPSTAQILAHFSNGLPAISLNKYGNGQVLLFNWDATERHIAVSSVLMSKVIEQYTSSQKGDVGIFYSETNGKDYGFSSFEKVMQWVEYLGWEPRVVFEGEPFSNSTMPVLIMPNIYQITAETANQLEKYVRDGGNVIFIDGPTKSIHLRPIQAITGMTSRSKYFNQPIIIYPNSSSDLIPTQAIYYDIETYQSWIAEWTEYRQDGINSLLKDVYRRVKVRYPQTEISVTITADIEEASHRYMQDWQDWLRYGYIDLLIPRAYADSQQELESILQAWRVPIKIYPSKIKMGLISYVDSGSNLQTKTSEVLLREIEALEGAGLNGVLMFHLETMSYLQLSAIKHHFLLRQGKN